MVSVIIPYFKAEQWISGTIESCLKQGELLHEILIVDDHSLDNGKAIIEDYVYKYPGRIKYYLNLRKGANTARTFGFSKATGKYIQWLDADDTILPGKFKAQIECLQKEGADVCYSDWRMDHYLDGKKVREEVKMHKAYPDFTEQLLLDNWTSPNNYLMTYQSAKLTVEHDGWCETRRIAQDREFFTTCALLEHKFAYQKGIFAVYNRWSSKTVSGMDFKTRLELNQDLERKFFDYITESKFSEERKERYRRIIFTHHLKAIFYNRCIPLSYQFSLNQILWKEVHWKMRLMLPFLHLKRRILA